MAALTQARMTKVTTLSTVSLPGAASTKFFQGGMAMADTSAGVVKPGQSGTTLLRIGKFTQTVDNSGSTATTRVTVELEHEIVATWYDNATGANAVALSDLFSDVYVLDDHTVTKASSGNSKAGRVWDYDGATNTVLVESYTL